MGRPFFGLTARSSACGGAGYHPELQSQLLASLLGLTARTAKINWSQALVKTSVQWKSGGLQLEPRLRGGDNLEIGG